MLVLDNRPFPDLRHLVMAAKDPRLRVFAEWVRGRAAQPVPPGRPGTHPRVHGDRANRATAV